MKRLALCAALLVAGCSEAPNTPGNDVRPVELKVQSRVLILSWLTYAQRKTEEARLDAATKEGWRVVHTETRSAVVQDDAMPSVEWTVTVTLEREK